MGTLFGGDGNEHPGEEVGVADGRRARRIVDPLKAVQRARLRILNTTHRSPAVAQEAADHSCGPYFFSSYGAPVPAEPMNSFWPLGKVMSFAFAVDHPFLAR